MRSQALLLTALLLALPTSAPAIELGLATTSSPGANAVVNPAGSYGAAQVGWNPEPAGNVGDVQGDYSGNAIVLTGVTDQVVQEADNFTISWTSSSGPGSANVDVTGATTVGNYCGLVHAHADLTCSVRPEGVQITTPFLTNISAFSFTHAAVPGQESHLTISGISDASAAAVNRFELRIAGRLYTAPSSTFSGITTVAELASALDALPFVKTGEVTATSIQLLANDFGPQGLADARLDHFLPAVSPQVTFADVSDADAGRVSRLRLERDGAPVSQAGIDFSAATDLATLAAQLDGSPDISAQVSGDDLILTLSPPGAGTLTHASLHVLPVLQGTGTSFTYVEGQSVPVDETITVVQPSAPVLAGAVVAVTDGFVPGEDLLSTTAPGGLLVSYDAGTGVLSLTGPGTLNEFQDALRSLRYTNSSQSPSATERTLTITAADAHDVSSPRFYSVTPGPVNDEPTVTTAGAQGSYTENQGPVPADDGLTLTDADDLTLSRATVQITGGHEPAEDLLASAGSDNIAVGYDAASATLTLTGPAPVAEFEAVLRSVTYDNRSEAPSGTSRVVTFVVEDASASSSPATRTIAILGEDDPPVLALTAQALSYTENAVSPVDDALALSDVDGDSILRARVAIGTGHREGEDVLGFTDQGGITGSWVAATGVLTLEGTASAQGYRDALRSVSYQNLSDAPDTTSRSIEFTLELSEGGPISGSRTLTILPVNDPPVLTVGATTGGTLPFEGTGPVALGSELTLMDPDDTQLVGATVRISSGAAPAEDALGFQLTGAITGAYEASLSRLTLSGTAPLSEYRTVLASLTFENLAEDPTPGEREISFQAQDSAGNSNIAVVRVEVLPAPSGCGCGSANSSGAAGLLVFLLPALLLRRGRRPPR